MQGCMDLINGDWGSTLIVHISERRMLIRNSDESRGLVFVIVMLYFFVLFFYFFVFFCFILFLIFFVFDRSAYSMGSSQLQVTITVLIKVYSTRYIYRKYTFVETSVPLPVLRNRG